MIQKDLNWKSEDGISFFAHTWQPEEKPKAVITMVHGFGEHCLRYTPYFEYFVAQGIAILGFDLQGHGQTEGKRGVINSYEGLMNHIQMSLENTIELFPNIPHFIYGHSMGGNLALNYLLLRTPDLQGGIISSPWLALTHEPNFILKAMVSIMNKLAPNITANSNLEINHISTDKTEVEKYKSDPLNHGKISFRLLHAITQTGLWASRNTQKLKIPVLLMHGLNDEITSPKASKIAYTGNKEKIEFVEWSGRYHELQNETNRAEVAKTVIDWLNKKI